MAEEVVVPFRAEPDTLPPAIRVRSTLITSSLDALRRRGRMDRYEAALAPEHKATLLSCVAGIWLPMEVGLAHYEACNALGLTPAEIDQIGEDVSVRVQATFLATLGKMARTAGVTPWTGLSQFQRLWDRVLDGGGVCVTRLGPKDARIEIAALPLVDVPYFRTALRQFIITGCAIFVAKVYGRVVWKSTVAGRVEYRISWA